MFRTVSQIRAQRGLCFIVTNTPASRQRSDRAPASLVEAGEGIEEGILRNIDLRVESPRGALVRSIWVPFFLKNDRTKTNCKRAGLMPGAYQRRPQGDN